MRGSTIPTTAFFAVTTEGNCEMAQPTSHTSSTPPQMQGAGGVGAAPGGGPGLPGMGRMGGGTPAQGPDVRGADPVLFEDIEPMYLARLYPHAKSGEEARAHAMEAGKRAQDEGQRLVA